MGRHEQTKQLMQSQVPRSLPVMLPDAWATIWFEDEYRHAATRSWAQVSTKTMHLLSTLLTTE